MKLILQAIKALFRKLETALSKIEAKLGSMEKWCVSPDWNAAEGEPGHVLNRTHWVDVSEETIFPEAEVVWNADNEYTGYMELPSPLVVGNTYKVSYDGVEYVCKAWEYEGMPTIGNKAQLGSGFEDSGEPFAIIYMDGMGMLINLDSYDSVEGSAVVGIVAIVENVTPIPKKYLEAALPYYVEVTYDGSGYSTTQSATELRAAIAAGRAVYLRHKTDTATEIAALNVVMNEGLFVFMTTDSSDFIVYMLMRKTTSTSEPLDTFTVSRTVKKLT